MSIYDKVFGKGSEERDFLLEIGLSLSRLGRLKEAKEAFRKVIKIDPKSVDAHISLGLLLEESGKDKDAEKEYKTALRIDPEKVEMYNQIGTLFLKSNRYDEFGIDESTPICEGTDAIRLDKTEGLSKGNPIVVETIMQEYRFTRKYKCPRCKNIGFHLVKHATEHYFDKVISVHFAECNSCS